MHKPGFMRGLHQPFDECVCVGARAPQAVRHLNAAVPGGRESTQKPQNTFVSVAKNVVCSGFDTAMLPDESAAPVV